MRTSLVALLLIALCLSAPAQAMSVGEPFAATNTRYGTLPSVTQLISNGTDVFALWRYSGVLFMTKVGANAERIGQPVLASAGGVFYGFDAIWTGENFLVVGSSAGMIRGVLLDREAKPIGASFPIAKGTFPMLAFNGTTVLLGYDDGDVYVQPLTPKGAATAISAQKMANEDYLYAMTSSNRGFAVITRPYFGSFKFTELNAAGAIGYAQPLPAVGGDGISLASDGTSYLVVGGSWQGAKVTRFNGDSIPQPVIQILPAPPPDQSFYNSAVVWTGTEYVVSFIQSTLTTTGEKAAATQRSMRLDANGAVTFTGAARPASPGNISTSVIANGGRALVSWSVNGPSVIDEVPSIGDEPTVLSYGAGPQQVLASASSANGSTLLVWLETVNGGTVLRFGLRDANGGWREGVIAQRSTPRAVASSDGNGFAVAIADPDPKTLLEDTTTIFRISANAEVFANTAYTPFVVTDMRWNGSEYAVIGYKRRPTAYRQTQIIASTMDASGATGVTSVIRGFDATERTEPGIAWSGDGYLVAWHTGQFTDGTNCTGTCQGSSLRGVFVDRDLLPSSNDDLRIALDEYAQRPVLAWNGREYIVVWSTTAYLKNAVWATSVSPTGTFGNLQLSTASVPASNTPRIATLADGTSVVAWADAGADGASPHQNIVVFDAGLKLLDRTTVNDGDAAESWIVPMPGRRAAIASTRVMLAAPHHGSSRVAMRIVDVNANVAPQVPAAPAVVIARVDGVQWSAVPNVTGYRIETRSGDGAWSEVEGFFDATTHEASMALPENTSVRVRAFSDRGASAPSNEARVMRAPSRRRSVR